MASVTKYRGNTWRAVVRRTGHPVQSKTFEKKADADKWAAEREAELGVSRYDPLQLRNAQSTTVGDIFDRYSVEVAPFMKGRNSVNTIIRLARDAKFMNMRLDRVTAREIRTWRDARAKQVKPQSVQREFVAMSGVFTHAIKEWGVLLAANPCRAVTCFPGSDKPRDKRWSPADLKTLLDKIQWKEDVRPAKGRDYVGWAVLLAVETAMREGELCGLRVADFFEHEHLVRLYDTKNGNPRDVPLSSKALRYVKFLCEGKKPGDKIIGISANTLCEYALDARRAADLEHLTFHDTRHEATTRLSQKLPNVLELSAVTGHKSLKSLKRYYNPTATELAAKLG